MGVQSEHRSRVTLTVVSTNSQDIDRFQTGRVINSVHYDELKLSTSNPAKIALNAFIRVKDTEVNLVGGLGAAGASVRANTPVHCSRDMCLQI